MSNRPLNVTRSLLASRHLLAAVLASSFIIQHLFCQPARAQASAYCQLSADETQQKENLRQSAQKGNKEDQTRYKTLLNRHAEEVKQCRAGTWPQTQAIWLRLYPCDIQPGAMDYIMDRIVNRGYNQVYIEVFYDGQVLLPVAANPTVWPSVVRLPGAENLDLLAQAIQKGHDRGLKVYAWMFTMNFGYTYAQRPDRQSVLARDGKGQISTSVVDNGSQVFIDPYNLQAKRDYYQMVQEVVRRRPDGVLFDYVRYPRKSAEASIATKVQDLWLYSEATQLALFRRALNNKGLELIRRFLSKGFVTVIDVDTVDKLYPQEGEPLWQGRTLPEAPLSAPLTAAERQPLLQWELWQLSVAHALQGVLDFLAVAVWPVQQQGLKAGAVFFPQANQALRQGYDSRLQPWDRFPKSLEWHAMAYSNCGNTSCITAEVQRVLQSAPPGTQVIPAIVGNWAKSVSNRPPLEVQMQAIRQVTPQIRAISHFAYSWQEPQFDSERKFCQIR